jgi:hypothetical protein
MHAGGRTEGRHYGNVQFAFISRNGGDIGYFRSEWQPIQPVYAQHAVHVPPPLLL